MGSDHPTFRVHQALGGLAFRLSDVVGHAGRATCDPTYGPAFQRAYDDIRAGRELLDELEAALRLVRADPKAEAA